MPRFLSNINLKPYNTFGLSAHARLFIKLSSEQELEWLTSQPEYQQNKVLWLGGGSNMLLTQDFDGLAVKLELKGRNIENQSEETAILTAKAGENWHQLVGYALDHNLGGIENLSLIPGNVGTAPIQNIGAYGVELKDVFHSLRAYDLQNRKFRNFTHEECEFGYRDSYFKRQGKGRYIITEVKLKLTRKNHRINTEYGAITTELQRLGLQTDIHTISRAVINIRQSKLPNPEEIGNSGSFFKNPVINNSEYRELKLAYPAVASFRLSDNEIKLAAGWLIEQAGWKGYRKGDAGVHNKQALVLVNYGKAQGTEIEALAREIQTSVFDKFAVKLEPEVNII